MGLKAVRGRHWAFLSAGISGRPLVGHLVRLGFPDSPLDGDTAVAVGRLQGTEERHGEALANGLRFLVAAYLWANLVGPLAGRQERLVVEALALAVYSLYAICLFVFLRSGPYRTEIAYVSVTLDATVTALYMMGLTDGLSRLTPASALFMLVLGIASAALRHRPALVLYAGLVNILLAAAVGLQTLQFYSGVSQQTRQFRYFSLAELAQRSVFLLAITVLLAYTARVTRRMIRRASIAAHERLREAVRLNAELEERVAQRTGELQSALAQRAVLDERARIAREMHDGLAKSLSGLGLEAATLARMQSDGDSPARAKALYVADLARHLASQAREMIYDFRATSAAGTFLDQIRHQLTQWQAATGIQARLEAPRNPGVLPLRLEYDVLRVVEEALTNVQRHARAREVAVQVAIEGDDLRITVRDDGQGFGCDDWQTLVQEGRFGLLGMRERAQRVGGDLHVESKPGIGTSIRLRVPLVQEGRESIPGS